MWSPFHTKLNEKNPTLPLFRRQEVIIYRLQIGHTCLIFRHLMTKTEPDKYPTREKTTAINHIVCYCRNYKDIRVKHDLTNNVHKGLNPHSTTN
jgi:hypothetical protein